MKPFATLRAPAPLRSLLLLLTLVVLAWSPAAARTTGLRALIVGGGPEPEHNQVAIERNVHYVTRLLPAAAPRTILFADGSRTASTVLYQTQPQPLAAGELAFALALNRRDEARPAALRYRPPQLPKLDGPAKRAAVERAFQWLRSGDPDPVLLYFTGHGSPAKDRNLDNNTYDLWGGNDRREGGLSVRDLAAHLATLPAEVPVTLVMVQCFSGAFGNLLFERGDPRGEPLERPLAGFFATTRERPAAGCTPEVNEAEYQDFSSYFFAALSGKDRVGRAVTGADYNRDGRVGMDEAFAYSQIHDVSIDVPVCTSDVFLRRVVPGEDVEIMGTPFSSVRAWATPAQVAALDFLSGALRLDAEDRLRAAYQQARLTDRRGPAPAFTAARRRFDRARREARQILLGRWPELRSPEGAGFAAARAQAVAMLGRAAEEPWVHELIDADTALTQAEAQETQGEVAAAQALRLVRLAKSVVLAHRLRENGDAADRARFDHLVAVEARSLLPTGTVTRP